MASSVVDQAAAPAQSAAKKGIPKEVVIAIVAIIVVAVVAIALVATGFGAPAQQEKGSQQASTASSGSSSGSDAAAAANEASSSSASASASAEASAPVETTAPLIDLGNSSDYYDINIFLSNFAEWMEFYRSGKTFDRDNYDLKQLVNWGMWHNAINNEGTLVVGAVTLPDAPDTEASRVATVLKDKKDYWRHMDTELIQNSIARYTGLDLDLSGYNPGDGSYFEQDGVMYEGLFRGDAAPLDNVALVNSVENTGGNRARVYFTVYSGYNVWEQAVSDKSWYGLDGASLEAAMRENGSSRVEKYSGTAVVEVSGESGDLSFLLVSFSCNL